MTPETILKSHSQSVPEWLASWKTGDGFPRSDFLASRVVIYPGSGSDGHAFRTFGASHAAHCFIHPDYRVSRETLLGWLEPESPDRLKGYQTAAHVDLTLQDLTPYGWSPPEFLSVSEMRRIAEHERSFMKETRHGQLVDVKPYGLFVVFDRETHLDDDHGPARLAALFLAANAQITYHALFCQRGASAPFGMILQDHGFGGNYDPFGTGGLLHKIAVHARSFPRFILGEKAWPEYQRLTEEPSVGGGNANRRFLFEQWKTDSC